MKQKIKQELKCSELVSIKQCSDNKVDFQWKEDHEFFYQGSLYDVVSTERNSSGELIYYCIEDKQEEMLFSNLDQLIEKKLNDENQSLAEKVIKYFTGFISEQHVNSIKNIDQKQRRDIVYITQIKKSPYILLTYPPPQKNRFEG